MNPYVDAYMLNIPLPETHSADGGGGRQTPMGKAFLSRRKASSHMGRNFPIPREFKFFFLYRHAETFVNDLIRILTIFGFIASLFTHLRTEKFSKAAPFLSHVSHLLPDIRYFRNKRNTNQVCREQLTGERIGWISPGSCGGRASRT